MAGKYGSQSIAFMVDGYNLISNKLKGLRYKVEALNEDTTGLGDSWMEHLPTGMAKVEVSQEGAFFDTATNNIHDAMSASVPSTPQDSTRVVNLAFAGATIGNMMVGFQGTFSTAYEVLSQVGQLTKANVDYVITGQVDQGVILQELATKTGDWDTNSTSVDDNGAGTSSGAIGYLQVTAFSGFSGFIATIEDSTDDAAWASLVAFSNVTSGPTAERVTVSGNVDRYISIDGNVTGTGSVTAFVGFKRNPD